MEKYKADMLREARSAFYDFYLTASPQDAHLMDAVVLGHAAMVVLLNAPREHVAPQVRRPLERVADGVDQLFAASREALRACETFRAVDQQTRDDIESMLLTIRPPV